jgi:hypothetical protein
MMIYFEVMRRPLRKRRIKATGKKIRVQKPSQNLEPLYSIE